MAEDKFHNDINMSDIEIPAIVQKKADLAFSQIREEEKDSMKTKKHTTIKNYIKPIVAVAACTVVMIGAYVSVNFMKQPASQTEINNEEANNGEDNNGVMSSIQNAFTLKVSAAELEKGHSVPLLIDGTASGYSLGGIDNGEVSYGIDMPFFCEGENISSITYKVSKGAFRVIEPKDHSIVTDGEIYDGRLNVGGMVPYDPSGELKYEWKQYKSYTVNYDQQTSDMTYINLCNEVKMTKSDQDDLFAEPDNLQIKADAFNKMLEGVEITCTIQYNDGTSEDAMIKVGSKVMTYREACGDTSPKADAESVFIMFELQ